METYYCDACGYSTKVNSNWHKHLKTRKHYKKTNGYETITPKKFKQKNAEKEHKRSTKGAQREHKSFFLKKNEKGSTKGAQKEHKGSTKEHKRSTNFCQNCKKSFSSRKILQRHVKKYCKNVKNAKNIKNITNSEKFQNVNNSNTDNRNLVAIIENMEKKHSAEKKELYDKIEHLLTEKAGNVTYNTQTINNTQNIVLNCYGSEDISYITDKVIIQLLKGPHTMIPRLIKATHFNSKHPENRNIFIPNKKQRFVKVFDGDQWKYKDKKETIMKLVDKNYDILDTYYEDEGLKDGLETYAKKRYNEFKILYENDNDMKKKIEQDSELLILNSSDENNIVSIKEI